MATNTQDPHPHVYKGRPLSSAQSHHDQPQGGDAGHPGCGRGEVHRRQGHPHRVPRHQVGNTNIKHTRYFQTLDL